MNTPQILLRGAVLASALLATAAVGTAQTVLYGENFNTPNSATALSSFGWAVFSGGAPSNPSVNSSGTSTGGIFDVQRAAQMNINTTNSTTSWFAGLRYTYTGALPTTDLSKLALSANVYAGGTVGARGDVTLRIESSANNWIGWTVSGTTLTSTNGLLTGGALDTTTHSAGTFNPNSATFNIVLAYANTLATWGNDSSNVIGIDNVSFQDLTPAPVPEPSAAAVLAGLVGLTAVATRRRR